MKDNGSTVIRETAPPEWIPSISDRPGPRYLAFVELLESDIESGALKPGTRLLPQRNMAEQLGVSVGTISRAYAEAESRGLVSGEVGRGTFVQRRRNDPNPDFSQPVNLALNVPPSTGEDELIARALAEVVQDGEVSSLLSYLPHQGLLSHRSIMAKWLTDVGVDTDIDRFFITHGGQQALSIALGMVASPGDTVLTETFTYSGISALSAQNGYLLYGVVGDENGLLPEALDRAFQETGARALFCTPTLQTPTGTVMDADRRRAIAEIVAKHRSFLLEDDVYAFLFASPPQPVSALIPDRSFYVTSFSKCLAPGLRIGAMIVPDTFRDRCINAVRASGWMASPVMAEVVARLIRSGDLSHQVKLKRAEAARRNALANHILGNWLPVVCDTPGFHRWLPLPAGRTLNALVAQAAHAGVALAPSPGALKQVDRSTLGLRICLGPPSTDSELKRALAELRRILEAAEEISFV
jgi:DNA-binding transcriptional MocR family regulator